MRVVPLGSGSNGNATLVELAGKRLLVDAGLSARRLAAAMRSTGVEPDSVDWILLTHEHQDHARGAERFSKLHGIPVISSWATLEAIDLSPAHFASWTTLPEDGWLDLGPCQVEAFPVPHDAARPVGFVIHGEGLRAGVATDLGHATTLVIQRLRGCHVLMLESNHDDEMLRTGPYPWHLKQRVGGRMGHLSNSEAAAVLGQTVDDSCQAVILAHLSGRNNTPDLARRTAARALYMAGAKRVEMRVASPRAPTPPICI